MNRRGKIALIILLILLAFVAGDFTASLRYAPKQPAAVTLLNGGGGGCPRTPSAQCVNPNCAGGPIYFECEYCDGSGCTTVTMGGGMRGAYNVDDAWEKTTDGKYLNKKADYDHAEFINFRVMVNNKAMEAVAVPLGSTITHVNGEFVKDQDRFAELVNDLRGKRLRFISPDGTRGETTLK